MNKIVLSFCLMIFVMGHSVCQDIEDRPFEIIQVSSIQNIPVVPFPEIRIKMSNCQFCYQNILPPRNKMYKEQLDAYDSWDTIPNCKEMNKIDYDSIVKFIITSDLLKIDLDYTKPDTTGGIITAISGGSGYRYLIETSEGNLDLLISGSKKFNLPCVLLNFDSLFKRVASRYED